MQKEKLDLLQVTLDVMVLRTLAAMGSLHGYGIAPAHRAGERS
jgi:PadR family transcriptional regulator PadR